MKTQEKVTIVLSGLAFILSVITFAIAYTRFEMPDLNTGSFLVSVLAVLVTFLLGWQIYNAVGVKRELEKFEEKINGYKTEINTIIDEKVTESEKNLTEKHTKSEKEFTYLFSKVLFYNSNFKLIFNAVIFAGEVDLNDKIKVEKINIILKSFENLLDNINDEERKYILSIIKEFSEERKNLDGIRYVLTQLDIIPVYIQRQ